MTIRQIIKKGLLKLRVKYPHEEEDNFFFNLQNFKDYFEKKNDQSKNFENFLLYISKNGSLSKAQLFQDLLVDFFLNKEIYLLQILKLINQTFCLVDLIFLVQYLKYFF